MKNQGTSNPQLQSLTSGGDLHPKIKGYTNRNLTSGTSDEVDVSVMTLAYGKDRTIRYGNEEQYDDRGLNLVGNKVEYVDKHQRITPAEKNRPYITSYD